MPAVSADQSPNVFVRHCVSLAHTKGSSSRIIKTLPIQESDNPAVRWVKYLIVASSVQV